MRDDPEVRQLRDQVRNLEAQVAFSRGRGGVAGGGCAIAGILAGLALVVVVGAGSFLLLRPSERTEDIRPEEARRESNGRRGSPSAGQSRSMSG